MPTVTQLICITHCWKCGIMYGVPDEWDEQRRKDGRSMYCPNGHEAVFRKRDEAIADEQTDAAIAERRRVGLAIHLADQAEAKAADAKLPPRDLKPHKCPKCGTGFMKEHGLNVHMSKTCCGKQTA